MEGKDTKRIGNPKAIKLDRLSKLALPSALKDSVYEIIKDMIVHLDPKDGEQLRVEAIANRMGISRTPVREALLRLESEGLVRTVPRVGFFVKGITKQDLRELFELREITEGYAAEKAAVLISGEDIARIEELQSQSKQAVDEGDFERFIGMEAELHSLIIKNSRNSRLLKMIESIKELTYRERLLSLRSPENVKLSVEEHQRIVEALRNRDGKLAGKLMRAHIRAVQNRLLEFLDLPAEKYDEKDRE